MNTLLVNRELYVSIPAARALKQVGYSYESELYLKEFLEVDDDEKRLSTARINLLQPGYFSVIRRVIKRLFQRIKSNDQIEKLESEYESLVKDLPGVYIDIDEFFAVNIEDVTVVPKRSDVQYFLNKEFHINITVTYNHYNGMYRAHMITEHFTKHHGEFKSYEESFDDCVLKVCKFITEGKK